MDAKCNDHGEQLRFMPPDHLSGRSTCRQQHVLYSYLQDAQLKSDNRKNTEKKKYFEWCSPVRLQTSTGIIEG